MITAVEALARLKEGNNQFVADIERDNALYGVVRREELVRGQAPMAVVLGCSDSRVPPEIIFNQGLGDLFVIRVAGNIVEPSQMGSIEFAVEHVGTRLVVVLGHSHCGAVLVTVEQLQRPPADRSPNLAAIIDFIRPSVAELRAGDPKQDAEALVEQAVRANIRRSAGQLREGSKIMERLIKEDGLLVVGAVYSLETGQVDFFDGIPE